MYNIYSVPNTRSRSAAVRSDNLWITLSASTGARNLMSGVKIEMLPQ